MVLLLHKLMLSGENGINVPLIQHSPDTVVGGDVASTSVERNMVTMHGPAPTLLLQSDFVVMSANGNSFQQASLELMGGCPSPEYNNSGDVLGKTNEFKESKESKSEDKAHEFKGSQIRVPVEEAERNGVQKMMQAQNHLLQYQDMNDSELLQKSSTSSNETNEDVM